MQRGIGRIAILFGIGYKPNRKKECFVVWQLTLVGMCCLENSQFIMGTSYTNDVLQLYGLLEKPLNQALRTTIFPCICSKPENECSDTACRDTKRMMEQLQGETYDPLRERLEICIDLMDADLVAPLRDAHCHNLQCDRPLPNNRKNGGFLCIRDCRRVIYCSAQCRKRLQAAHLYLGCEPYHTIVQSQRLKYI